MIRPATDDRLNGLILQAGLAWREVEVLRTLRNHLLQIRPYYNAETVNGVLLRESAAGPTTDGTIVHPPEVVRQDGDDPYLVVGWLQRPSFA